MAPKVADVCASADLAIVTGPGPLTTLQVTARREASGRPSSVTRPSRNARSARVITWSAPALTLGAAPAATATVVIVGTAPMQTHVSPTTAVLRKSLDLTIWAVWETSAAQDIGRLT